MNVVIVDDDPKDIERIKAVVQKYTEDRKMQCIIDVFSKPGEILAQLDGRKKYDLFLLDIVMADMDGRALFREIRTKYVNPICIFVTYSSEYAVECYEYNTFRYVLKAELEEKLPKALDASIEKLKELKKNARFLPLELGNGIRRINYEDIFFIMKEKKYVIILLREEACKVRMTLAQIMELLDSEHFVYTDKSYIVNLMHVVAVEKYTIKLSDGREIPVSIPRYEQFLKRVSGYIRQFK